MSAYDRTNVDFRSFNMSRLGPTRRGPEEGPYVSSDIKQYDIRLLQRCKYYWDALYSFRERRRRNRMYNRGDQWKDLIFDSDNGEWLREEDYIRRQGKQPLKQNQIRQLVKRMIGEFRADSGKSAVISRQRSNSKVGEMLTNTLHYALDVNQVKRVDTRAFEEFLLSGIAFQKVRYKYMPRYNRDDLYIENRFITHMFFNDNIKDVRLDDMDLVGEFYDLPLDDVKAIFAKSEEHQRVIEQIYSSVIPREDSVTGTDPMLAPFEIDNIDFYNPIEPHLCRVYEIWQKMTDERLRCHDWLKGEYFTATLDQQGTIDMINKNRIDTAVNQGVDIEEVPIIEYEKRIERFWHVKFLSPHGYCLYESETVYEHKEHPYALLLYPLVDGEVWGFVEDVIDQQRYVNRLIMLMDFMIGSSAKGVLLVPEEAIPDDMDIDDFADEWTRFNGVIKIKTKAGVKVPEQISTNASIPGVNDLLSLQLKFMNDISGLSEAAQGRRSASGTPASLYAQETINASLNTKDYFDSFNEFTRERDMKALKVIIQYYDEERKIALAGSNYSEEAMIYSPEKAKSAEVDVVMTKTADSPIYRSVIEDSLQQFVSAGLIDLEMYLKNSTLPFSDKLLEDIRQRKEQMLEQGAIDPQLMQQLGTQLQGQGANPQAADPQTMKILEQYFAGR